MPIDPANRVSVLRNTLFARSIHPDNIFEGLTSAISAPGYHQLKCHVDSFNDPNPLYDICVMASIMFLDTTDEKQTTPKVLRPINIAYFRKSCDDFMRRWSDSAKIRYITLNTLESLPCYRKQITPHIRFPVQKPAHTHGYYHRLPSIDPCSYVSLYVDAISKLCVAFPNLTLHQSASLFIPVIVGVAPQLVHSIYTMWISRGRLPTGPLIVAIFFKQCTQSRFKHIPGWIHDDPRRIQQLKHVSVRQIIDLCANVIRVHRLFSLSKAQDCAPLTMNDLVVQLWKGTDRKLASSIVLYQESAVSTALCMLLTRFIDRPSIIFEPERTLITQVNTLLKSIFNMELDHTKTLSLVTSVSLSLDLPLRLGCNAIIQALTHTQNFDYFHKDQSLFTASTTPPLVTEYPSNSQCLLLPRWTPIVSEDDDRILKSHQSCNKDSENAEAVFRIPSPTSTPPSIHNTTPLTNTGTNIDEPLTLSGHHLERMLFAAGDETRSAKRARLSSMLPPDPRRFIAIFFPESLSKTSRIPQHSRSRILRNLFDMIRIPCAPINYVRRQLIPCDSPSLLAPTPFASSQLVPPNSIRFDERSNDAYFIPGDCIPEIVSWNAANNTTHTVSYFDVSHLLQHFLGHLQAEVKECPHSSYIPQHFPLGRNGVRFVFLPNPSENMKRIAEVHHHKDIAKIVHFSECLRAICFLATSICKTSFFRFVLNKTGYQSGHHIFLADMSTGIRGRRGRQYVPMFTVQNEKSTETLSLRFPGVLHTEDQAQRISILALSITR